MLHKVVAAAVVLVMVFSAFAMAVTPQDQDGSGPDAPIAAQSQNFMVANDGDGFGFRFVTNGQDAYEILRNALMEFDTLPSFLEGTEAYDLIDSIQKNEALVQADDLSITAANADVAIDVQVSKPADGSVVLDIRMSLLCGYDKSTPYELATTLSGFPDGVTPVSESAYAYAIDAGVSVAISNGFVDSIKFCIKYADDFLSSGNYDATIDDVSGDVICVYTPESSFAYIATEKYYVGQGSIDGVTSFIDLVEYLMSDQAVGQYTVSAEMLSGTNTFMRIFGDDELSSTQNYFVASERVPAGLIPLLADAFGIDAYISGLVQTAILMIDEKLSYGAVSSFLDEYGIGLTEDDFNTIRDSVMDMTFPDFASLSALFADYGIELTQADYDTVRAVLSLLGGDYSLDTINTILSEKYAVSQAQYDIVKDIVVNHTIPTYDSVVVLVGEENLPFTEAQYKVIYDFLTAHKIPTYADAVLLVGEENLPVTEAQYGVVYSFLTTLDLPSYQDLALFGDLPFTEAQYGIAKQMLESRTLPVYVDAVALVGEENLHMTEAQYAAVRALVNEHVIPDYSVAGPMLESLGYSVPEIGYNVYKVYLTQLMEDPSYQNIAPFLTSFDIVITEEEFGVVSKYFAGEELSLPDYKVLYGFALNNYGAFLGGFSSLMSMMPEAVTVDDVSDVLGFFGADVGADDLSVLFDDLAGGEVPVYDHADPLLSAFGIDMTEDAYEDYIIIINSLMGGEAPAYAEMDPIFSLLDIVVTEADYGGYANIFESVIGGEAPAYADMGPVFALLDLTVAEDDYALGAACVNALMDRTAPSYADANSFLVSAGIELTEEEYGHAAAIFNALMAGQAPAYADVQALFVAYGHDITEAQYENLLSEFREFRADPDYYAAALLFSLAGLEISSQDYASSLSFLGALVTSLQTYMDQHFTYYVCMGSTQKNLENRQAIRDALAGISFTADIPKAIVSDDGYSISYVIEGDTFAINYISDPELQLGPMFDGKIRTDLPFTVVFAVDGTAVSTQELLYGMEIEAPADPVKAGDAQYSYVFGGWDGFTEGMSVTGDATFNAVFDRTVNQYDVIFYQDDHQTVFRQYKLDYGSTVTFPPELPVKAAEGSVTYVFTEWDFQLPAQTSSITVTGDLAAYPVFERGTQTVDNATGKTTTVVNDGDTVVTTVYSADGSSIRTKEYEVVDQTFGTTASVNVEILRDNSGAITASNTTVLMDSDDGAYSTVATIESSNNVAKADAETLISVGGSGDLDPAVIADALDQLTLAEATINDVVNENGLGTVTVRKSLTIENSGDSSTVVIGGQGLDCVAGEDVDLIVTSDVGTIVFDNNAVGGLSTAAGNDPMAITLAKATNADLSTAQQAVVGDHAVFMLSAVSSTGASVHELGGFALVTVPYQLKSGEDPDRIVVFFVDEDGSTEMMTSSYDAQTGTVSFLTDHFSVYVISQESDLGTATSTTIIMAMAVILGAVVVAALAGAARQRRA